MSKDFAYALVCSLKTMAVVLFVTQTAFAQATGPFNVRTYGATGAANCSLDQAGFNAALAAVPASGGEIYVPAGTYCLNQPLTISGKSIAFRGEGQKLSIVRWDAPSNGIVFFGMSKDHSLTVKSLSLLQNAGVNSTAIYGQWYQRSYTSVLNISDVAIGHHQTASEWDGWESGIVIIDGANVMIHQFEIFGPSIDANTQAAIVIAGQTIHANITKGSVLFWKDGIRMIDHSEGLHVSDVEIVGTERGIVVDSLADLPGTSIANNHIATSKKGIYMWRQGDVAISGNLLYSQTFSTNYIGIHVINTDSLRITGNQIVKLGEGDHNGIVVEGTSPANVISNNVTQGMHTGIWLTGTGVTKNLVIGNINRIPLLYGVLDYGTPGSNTFVNNH